MKTHEYDAQIYRFDVKQLVLNSNMFVLQPFSPCESPLALLGQYLTLADYVDLLDVCDKVIEKFSPLYR